MKTIKILSILLFTLFLSVSLKAQDKATANLPFNKTQKIKVGFLIYEGVEALDLNGPIDVFVKANRIGANYELYLISAGADQQISTEKGVVKITAPYTIKDAPQTDILIIPGAPMNVIADLINQHPELTSWIVEQNKKTTLTASVCTAGLLLANTGLLNGHSATTHPMSISDMKKYKDINVKENVRFVVDGKFITASGISSGIDGALQIIEMINGKALADKISRILVYNRAGDMSFMMR